MAVCFFNGDYKRKFSCEYEKKDNGIEVIVDYEILDEIPETNGSKLYTKDIEFDERDILIIDNFNKKNYLLKNAGYVGYSSSSGTPDGGTKTSFYSNYYFAHRDYNKLCDLPKMPKVKKIKIFSSLINDIIGYPSVDIKDTSDECVINLNKNLEYKQIVLGKNNINNITINDIWNSIHSFKNRNLNVELSGYIEIELLKRVNYDEIFEYIYELMIFMQLLYPNKFNINKIHVLVNDIYYEIFLPIEKINYNNKFVNPSVDDDFFVFLEKCYNLIPYRKGKHEIRNIPYIVMNSYRGLEDNFLMFYRFIECYYKKKSIVNNFISYSIEHNYPESRDMNEDDIEKLSAQVNSLRNQYVHSGYYIKNDSLRIKFKDVNEDTPNPKNYTENNVDVDWIYNKTKILYKIVLNIIFKEMLNYNNYKFIKHF